MRHWEILTEEDLKNYQIELLKVNFEYIFNHSAFYQSKIKTKLPIKNENVLKIYTNLPFTSKEDLHANNLDFLCVENDKIIDYTTTSGTSGDPVLIALTEKDLDRLADNESYSFELMDLNQKNIIQNTTTLDRRFMAGLAYFLGARKSGIGMIRVGSGVPELQWDTIKKIKSDTLICVPSFLLKLIEYAHKNNISLEESSIKKILCIGEPIRNSDFTYNVLGQKITDNWPVKLYSTYASTEMATAFTECSAGEGGHLNAELIFAEILDESGELKSTGIGELIITTLGVEGMPLIKFKTGDLVELFHGKCSCGRNTPRIGPVLGRKNQMIKYKGTTIYPPILLDLLNEFSSIDIYVIEVYHNSIEQDEIVVRLSSNANHEELEDSIKDKFRAKLRVSPKIIFDEFTTVQKLKFPENARKSVTFIDYRVNN